MNAHEILGVSLGATQEEITKAYRRLALKYHPDRNRGNEEWAKKKFIEVGEAFNTLSESAPKRKFQFSDKPGSDKFKEFEEMLNELKAEQNETREGLKKDRETLNQVQEELRKDAIQNTEEKFSLAGVSSSDLDSSLWTPYGDWKEKFSNLFNEEVTLFLSQMTVAIEQAKWKKINNNKSRQGGDYSYNDYSWQNSQQPKRSKYGDNPPPNYSDRNFSPNDSGWTGENKPFSIEGNKIQQLEFEIKFNKQCLLKTSDEREKQKYRKMISESEKELRKLRNQHESSAHTQPNSSSSSDDGNDNEKDEKISQLENEIEQLKKNDSWDPRKRQENQKKLAQKEQELSELEKSSKDNNVYEDWDHEQLINEIKRLKRENETTELTKKFSQVEKVVQQLTKEIQELKTEIQGLKNKENRSGYENYYLSRQESQLKNKQAKLEKLRDISSSSSSSSSSSDFPTGLVVGGGILVALGLVAVLIVKKHKKKK